METNLNCPKYYPKEHTILISPKFSKSLILKLNPHQNQSLNKSRNPNLNQDLSLNLIDNQCQAKLKIILF